MLAAMHASVQSLQLHIVCMLSKEAAESSGENTKSRGLTGKGICGTQGE